MMNIRCYIALFLLMLVVSGCQRRSLEIESGDVARVPVHVDWAQSELDIAKAHNVSLWFFPHDGSPSFEYRLDGNLVDGEVQLSGGSYSIVAFNEAVDTYWSSLEFSGSDKYETFRVAARLDDFRGMNSRADDADLRKSPDALASWSCNRFDVTSEMIHITSQGSRADDLGPTAKISVVLKSLTRAVAIKAYVQNLTSARLCSGTLVGVVGEVMLSTGKASVNNASHIFIMNNRIPEQGKPNNGYIHANFFVFNTSTTYQKVLQIDFEMYDNTIESPDSFDVTTTMDQEKPKVEVIVGIDIEPEDHPIILPERNISGDVVVDDWVDQQIPIN